MSKGDAEHAAQHQHGVQVKETGTTGSPVTEERIAALEVRVAKLEAAEEARAKAEKKPEAGKKDKAA